MRIKNTSAGTIKFPEFDLVLKPGDEADLSKFDPALISNHPTLTSYFQKGILINLGFAKTTGSKQRLNSTRSRIERLNINDNFVLKQKDPSFDKKKEVKKAERRDVLKNNSKRSEIERYKIEHLQNSDPLNFDFEATEKPKPRPKIQKSVPAMNLGLDGHFHPTLNQAMEIPSGTIFPRELVGETTFLALEAEVPIKKSIKDSDLLLSLDGEAINLDLEKVKNKIESYCLATQANGKPCGKKKVRGFDVCFGHMTESEKEHHKQQKQKSSSQLDG